MADDKKAPEYKLDELAKVVADADAETIARLQAEEKDGDDRRGANDLFDARLKEIADASGNDGGGADDKKAPARARKSADKSETTTLPPPTSAEVKVAEPAAAGEPTDSTFTAPPQRSGSTTPGVAGRPHQVRTAAPPAPTTVEPEASEADVVASHQRARGVAPAAPAPTRPEEWAAHQAAATGAANDAELAQIGTEKLRKAAKKR